MEINYLKLKHKLFHTPEKVLEIAIDWYKYAEALYHLKNTRHILDVDGSENAYDNFIEDSKEPFVIKDQVEKKFKSLLGKDWQKLPLDYFERMEKMKKPKKEFTTIQESLIYYYQDSENLHKLLEQRRKEEGVE